MEFTTKDELFTFLQELQGQLTSMQETIDTLAPVSEEPPVEEGVEEVPEAEPTEEEISEIDQLLQSK